MLKDRQVDRQNMLYSIVAFYSLSLEINRPNLASVELFISKSSEMWLVFLSLATFSHPMREDDIT